MLRIFALVIPLALLSLTLKHSPKSFVAPKQLSPAAEDTLKLDDMVFADFFSPNGDGYNDTFFIYNLQNHPGSSIKIFNRWGEIVYKGEPYMNDWNGMNNQPGSLMGHQCTEGVYYFEFQDTKGNKVTGKITLKR